MVNVTGEWVEFRFFRPHAEGAYLAGDFNGWRREELRMSADADGYWTAKLRLQAGEYKFRYYCDGQWFTDYAAFGVEPGDFGLDSIVRVPERKLSLVSKSESGAADKSEESKEFAAA